MTYRIEALPVAPFAPYFTMTEAELAAVGARRWIADAPGRAPCRVSLRYAAVGDSTIRRPNRSISISRPGAATWPGPIVRNHRFPDGRA